MKVLLIHGLFMRPFVMWRLASRLRAVGHEVLVFGYGLFPKQDELHADFVLCVNEYQPDAIIGHSMGGLIALDADSHVHFDSPPKKILCLGSPVAGSSVARKVRESSLCFLLSKATKRLLCQGVRRFAHPGTTVGMIAGTDGRIGFNTLMRAYRGPGDGTVELQETIGLVVDERSEVPVGHTALLFSAKVFDLIEAFLRRGMFDE
ncbi:MAG: hypothetical protein RIQ41_256 [Candidatus Parcubacteria bacterium]|jgi:predicted alpha/beta hydrolase